MTLSKLLDGVSVIKMFQTMYGKMVVTHDVEVRSVQYDSRRVEHGDMFVAIKGGSVDGHKFISNAITNGAKVVVVEDDTALPDSFFMHAGVVKVVVGDSRKALAEISGNFFSHPSRKLRLIGVTGTNGKTSTTLLIKSILEAQGEKVGVIGTIAYMIGDEVIPSTHTTPESLELNELLATMVQRGCTATVMEVSSHALVQKRVHGLKFSAAAFTNLSQDHLDFHKSMGEYFRAKKILFDDLDATATAITNSDDQYGHKIVENTKAQTITYGIAKSGSVHAADIELGLNKTTFTVSHDNATQSISSPLLGRFNVENILAAYATGISLGIEPEVVAKGITNLESVHGRFEQILSPDGWTAVVDYAHTPDALENCLYTIKDIQSKQRGRIITVFGCGGNRDRGKRPQMGRIATEHSNVTILTSDNPRHEDPHTIIDEIKAGCIPGASVEIEPDRGKAIKHALEIAKQGDVVLLAGKGHEDYQVIGEEKIHFDDREEVETFIRKKR